MHHLQCFAIAAVLIVTAWFSLTTLNKHLDPNTSKSAERSEDARWVATSSFWLDRQACRWVGLCGLAHWRPDPPTRPWNKRRARKEYKDFGAQERDKQRLKGTPYWEDIPGEGKRLEPGDWDGDPRVLKEVPQYVIDHAPLIHLYSGEQFWPSDITEHLMNTVPYLNHTTLNMTIEQHTPYNLHELNNIHKGRNLFMQSKDDVEERPDWLGSAFNKPIPYDDDEDKETEYRKAETTLWKDMPDLFSSGNTATRTYLHPELRKKRSNPTLSPPTPALPKPGGYSRAPVILIIVDKGNGVLDAFWFYFYSYNLGTTVLNIRFGNHIGDWEHSLIRFEYGIPKAVFFSAHSGGLAYNYTAVEKGKGKGREGRPVLYSAVGSHAMYATPGRHPYILPFGLLADVTDRGPIWDPSLNYLAYHYNASITHDMNAELFSAHSNKSQPDTTITDNKQSALATAKYMSASFQPAACNPTAPLGWWWYSGRWGDKFYELRDWRQWRFAGQYHYVNGPLGPRFKNLGRAKVCQSGKSCRIVDDLSEGGSWVGGLRMHG